MDRPMTGTHPVASTAKKYPNQDANYLMDEIFGDVEQALDDSLLPPDEPVKLEFGRPDQPFDIAAALADRYPQLALKLEEANQPTALPTIPAPSIALSKPADKIAAPPTTKLSLFERLMIFTGCASAIAALAVWVVSQGLVPKAATAFSQKLGTSVATNAANSTTINPVDAKFADYMLRSLASIDRDQANRPKTAAPLSPVQSPIASSSTTTLPQPTVLNLPVPGAKAPIKVGSGPVSRIGEPIRIESPVATAPTTTAPTTDVVTRSELNQVMNRIVGMLERVAPGVSNRLPLGGAKAPAPAAPARVAAKATAATVVNQPQRLINGIVEWGDKSVVTFSFNGVTQRVSLGENVGSSGWTLVEVKDGRATFRKNGEFRTLADGEFL
jgi:hypothetical protein